MVQPLVDKYFYFYKDGVVLRSHRKENLEVDFEFFNIKINGWEPIPNNQILSMNIGKYRFDKKDLDFYIKEIFQRATS